MEYKIEKDIPVPPRTDWGSGNTYPYKNMIKGDSFFVPNYYRDKMQRFLHAGRSYFDKIKSKSHLTVCARTEGKGFRVWVIKRPIKTK